MDRVLHIGHKPSTVPESVADSLALAQREDNSASGSFFVSKLVWLYGFISQGSIGCAESPITNTGTSTPLIVLDALDSG